MQTSAYLEIGFFFILKIDSECKTGGKNSIMIKYLFPQNNMHLEVLKYKYNKLSHTHLPWILPTKQQLCKFVYSELTWSLQGEGWTQSYFTRRISLWHEICYKLYNIYRKMQQKTDTYRTQSSFRIVVLLWFWSLCQR